MIIACSVCTEQAINELFDFVEYELLGVPPNMKYLLKVKQI